MADSSSGPADPEDQPRLGRLVSGFLRSDMMRDNLHTVEPTHNTVPRRLAACQRAAHDGWGSRLCISVSQPPSPPRQALRPRGEALAVLAFPRAAGVAHNEQGRPPGSFPYSWEPGQRSFLSLLSPVMTPIRRATRLSSEAPRLAMTQPRSPFVSEAARGAILAASNIPALHHLSGACSVLPMPRAAHGCAPVE